MPGCVQPVSVSKKTMPSLVIDLFGSNAGVGVAPSVALTRPIVTLSATETAASGSATGLSLSNVGYTSLTFCENFLSLKLDVDGAIEPHSNVI